MKITGETTNTARTRTKAACIAAAGLLLATPAWAQEPRTGVSMPPPMQSEEPVNPAPAAKPSAAIPMDSAQPAAPVVYGPYVPYVAKGATAPAADPDAAIAGDTIRRPLAEPGTAPTSMNDPDAGIVTHVPTIPGEISDGTLLKARLREELSTLKTKPGATFTAELSEPIVQDGRVYIPVGALVEGRVTYVRGGSRISGGAAIHLEPRAIVLPDGTRYSVHAQVIDTSSWDNTKVDSEGTITRREHIKGTLAAVGLATGSGAAAGAMIGGVPGALIGAGVGAGVSAVVWLKQDREAVLPKDLGLVFSLTAPITVSPSNAMASGE